MTGRSHEQLGHGSDPRADAGLCRAPIDDRASTRAVIARALLAEEGEAAAVAEKLHEQPVQILTAVGLRMSAFASGRGTPELAIELQDRLDRAIGQLRRTMHLLRQERVVEHSLDAELRREIEEIGRWHPHVRASLDIQNLPPCSRVSSVVVLRLMHAAMEAALAEDDVDAISLLVDGSRHRVVCRLRTAGRAPEMPADRIRVRLATWLPTVGDLQGSFDLTVGSDALLLSLAIPSDL